MILDLLGGPAAAIVAVRIRDGGAFEMSCARVLVKYFPLIFIDPPASFL